MKKIILFILIILSSCSFVPESPLDLLSSQNTTSTSVEEMDRRYPYLKVTLRPFEVHESTLNERARQIDIKEKRNILEKVEFMRFIINTPEFETNLLKGTFKSARTSTGYYGTVSWGDTYDNKRILELLQNAHISTRFGKQHLNSGVGGAANLGPHFYITANSLDSMLAAKGNFIILPNREYWAEGGYLKDAYIAGLIFHELLHNMGFNHGGPSHDTVYGVQGVLTATVNAEWRKKYKKQLASYKLYQTKYADWLTFITTPTRVHAKQSPMLNNDTYDREYPGELQVGQQGPQNEETIVCILYKDGTHKLVKMRNGRII